MANLQKGQSYPELGIRVDNKGITYDLNTGQTLSRAQVDALAKQNDLGTLGKKRGGINGFYDKNKSWIEPVTELGAGLLGGPAAAAALGAAYGAKSLKHPDLMGAIKKGATGYALGGAGSAMGGAANAGAGLGGTLKAGVGNMLPGVKPAGGMPMTSDFGNVANAAVGNDYLPFGDIANAAITSSGGTGISGLLDKIKGLPGVSSATDFLTGNNGLNALGTAQGVNAALLGQKSSQYAKDALGSVNSNWNANAPLRDAGRAGMLAPKPSVDTSFLPGIRKANVFARGG